MNFLPFLFLFLGKKNDFQSNQRREEEGKKFKNNTPSVPLCLSSIPFLDVPKYCPVSKNKSY